MVLLLIHHNFTVGIIYLMLFCLEQNKDDSMEFTFPLKRSEQPPKENGLVGSVTHPPSEMDVEMMFGVKLRKARVDCFQKCLSFFSGDPQSGSNIWLLIFW